MGIRSRENDEMTPAELDGLEALLAELGGSDIEMLGPQQSPREVFVAGPPELRPEQRLPF